VSEKHERPSLGRRLLVPALIALFVLAALRTLSGGDGEEKALSYTEFRRDVTAGRVSEVTVRGDEIHGTLSGDDGEQQFATRVPAFGDDELLPLLTENDVEVTAESAERTPWLTVILSLLPFLLIVGLFSLASRGMRGARGAQGLFSIRRNRARRYEKREEHTTFDDAAGCEGAKSELAEITGFLRDPETFRRVGGKPPNGVLLVGPPGTGKTLLARAVAGEADVPFFSITGSDFMEMFVGVGASRVRSLFRDAKETAPCILFIDELDSIGRRRGAGLGGGHDEREQTLNQLLSEMDGFEAREGVIVLAATNRPDILDPALLRPGRFDRRVEVSLPSVRDRREILAIHARGKSLGPDVDFEEIARGTPGFSGADLENLLNEAALLTARAGRTEIGRRDVEEARDKILMGLERKGLVLSDEETRLLACHEAGHAVTAAVLPHADPVHKVSIVPRGHAMGTTEQLPEGERYVLSRPYLLDRMAVMLGGRAAERLELGTVTSGAESDLKEVTQLARRMVLRWGMGEGFPDVAWDGQGGDSVFLGGELVRRPPYSDATARDVDLEIRSLVREAMERATGLLGARRAALRRVAAVLREEEVLSGARVRELIGEIGENDDEAAVGAAADGARRGPGDPPW
jgi:cell division protease FtsH